MKISGLHIPRAIRNIALVTPLVMLSHTVSSTPNIAKDVFVKSKEDIASTWAVHTKEETPCIIIGDEDIYPAVVIDLSDNQLYLYDYEGFLEEVYDVATGKKSTPTKKGLRIITAIEDYPYSNAYKGTRRYNNPDDYGPKVICLAPVDMKTGKILEADGQFIHGTNNPDSIGRKVSKGCIRMHNTDVDILANMLQVGQYVYIQE